MKQAGVTIKFPAGSIDGLVADAITMTGGKYEYDATGSKVSFSGRQFHEFVDYLNDALQQDYFEEDEKAKIRAVLQHVMSKLPQA